MSSQDNAMLLRLAASLGSETARAALSSEEQHDLGDGFELFMSGSAIMYGNFGVPRPWPYPLEAAMRMAVAVYRDLLPEWYRCFETQPDRNRIPPDIVEDLAFQVISTFSKWITQPDTFSWDEQERLCRMLVYDVCLDGYLTDEYPDTPEMIATYCYGLSYLVDIGTCRDEYNPEGKHSALLPDAVGIFLMDGIEEAQIRQAICLDVIPWCLGEADPLELGVFS